MDGGQRPPGLSPRRSTSPAQERLDRAGGRLGASGRAESVEDRLRRLSHGAPPLAVPPNDDDLSSDVPGSIDLLLAALGPGSYVAANWVRWNRHNRDGSVTEGWRDTMTGEWSEHLP